jgi:hypothetical protein
MAISAEARRQYKRFQEQIEALAAGIAAAHGFVEASRDPNTGRSATVTWERVPAWKRDELRLVFQWRTGHRQVFADVGLAVPLPDGVLVRIDGAPARWMARRAAEELRIPEGSRELPPDLASTLRGDLIKALAWLDARYATPALTLGAMESAERNGVPHGTDRHRAVCDVLAGLARGGTRGPEVPR